MAGNRNLFVLFDGCTVIISLVLAAAPSLPLGFISCSQIISLIQRKADSHLLESWQNGIKESDEGRLQARHSLSLAWLNWGADAAG